MEHLALLPEQAGFIESPTECLREADASDFWRPVGIYDGTELVGFAMYGYLPFLGEGQLWFDRLLIDKAFQGRAMPAAIAALLERLRQEYPCRRVYLSVYGDNAAAIHLSAGRVFFQRRLRYQRRARYGSGFPGNRAGRNVTLHSVGKGAQCFSHCAPCTGATYWFRH